MQAPQITFIVLATIGGTVSLVNHGKPKGDYNFIAWLVAAGIEIGVLYWGGFFG